MALDSQGNSASDVIAETLAPGVKTPTETMRGHHPGAETGTGVSCLIVDMADEGEVGAADTVRPGTMRRPPMRSREHHWVCVFSGRDAAQVGASGSSLEAEVGLLSTWYTKKLHRGRPYRRNFSREFRVDRQKHRCTALPARCTTQPRFRNSSCMSPPFSLPCCCRVLPRVTRVRVDDGMTPKQSQARGCSL